ncbi:hypothetical protein [Candidatus Uabimicrobium sp. HlEnr_7]|uniref:hypothetical protein n=1 Tax=Candidatus Uabimicrobium helgolandensis TaxID=3095367 RepID=UPI00355900A4
MKFICAFLCVLVPLFTEISKEQRQIMQPHLTIIENAIPILEKEAKSSKEKYQELLLKRHSTHQKLSNESSLIEKGVLRAKLLYYDKQLDSYREKITYNENQLAVYYGVLTAFSQKIAPKKIVSARNLVPSMQQKLKNVILQQQRIQERQQKAHANQKSIPYKQEKVNDALDELGAKLKVLEYKKTWSNLAERTKVISQISYQKGISAKLTAENIYLNKLIADCIKEQQSFLIERTELEIAIEELDR